MRKCDFGGYATKCNVRCSDGRIIMPDAFRDDDGRRVPLVWNHQHGIVSGVLGHAILENRKDGVYAYCYFNETSHGKDARECVRHGDVDCLSIYANKLKENGPNVVHGIIREVSLVLAGANPKAKIDDVPEVVVHADFELDDAASFCSNDPIEMGLEHSDSDKTPQEKEPENPPKKEEDSMEHAEGKTMQEIFDTLNDEQKDCVYTMIGMAVEAEKGSGDGTAEHSDINKEDENSMAHNVFDRDKPTENKDNFLSHDEMTTIIADAKRCGSMKEAFLQHGITDIDWLHPYTETDADGNLVRSGKLLNSPPGWITREMGWVQTVINGVHKTPFSRIKSMFADLTEDEARAKGYIKGNLKKEQVFSLLKRSTQPQTIYKKQKIDRDDVVDITEFDVIALLKSEMRFMLDEEIARAILIGDGRPSSSDDKISEDHIRPIAKDHELYTIKRTVNVGADEYVTARNFIVQAIKARKLYKGSGHPTLFTTEDMLTSMLLMTDNDGRDLYTDEAQLARKLRVSRIVTVEVMEGQTGPNDKPLLGIIVNLNDYNLGADKGGAVNMFDDFDIDYNAQKYLIETRCSGALVKPFSAIVLEASGEMSWLETRPTVSEIVNPSSGGSGG